MRREPQERTPDVRSHNIDAYKKGAQIVLRIGGEWVVAELQQDAEKSDDKMKMEVSYTENGTNITKEVEVGFEPKIITYPNGHKIISKTGEFDIGEVYVDPVTGEVEYTVTEKGVEGKTVGVPQELINLWKENEELESRHRQIQEDFKKLSTKRRLGLVDRDIQIQALLAEIFAHLPDVEKMNKRDTDQIGQLKSLINDRSKKASKLIEQFEADIVLLSASPDTSVILTVIIIARPQEKGKQEKNMQNS